MDLKAHSVPAFFSALDGVFRGVHYNADAEGLVVVVDNDNDPLHDSRHDEPGTDSGICRYCRIRKTIQRARNQLKPRRGLPPLRVAIGVAFPAIEAWYLVGVEKVGETAWKAGLPTGCLPRTRLKELVYGTGRPSLELETKCAKQEARRLMSMMTALESAFPVGFGLMAQEMRSWIA
ncbi:MAG: hypothetical protein KatS3mg105_0836 [Gemmatales bacterium]|nr:MAG: hypothetical protein KatS3mg105_0836 [Gemmatales bacterium]